MVESIPVTSPGAGTLSAHEVRAADELLPVATRLDALTTLRFPAAALAVVGHTYYLGLPSLSGERSRSTRACRSSSSSRGSS